MLFGKKGVTDLGGTPLPPFTDFSQNVFLQKRLKIVFFAKKKKTPEFGPKIGYGFGGYPPPPQWANFGLQVVELNQYWHLLYFLKKSSKSVIAIMTWQKKRQLVCVDIVARRASWLPPGPNFCQKICIFFTLHPYNPYIWDQTDPTQWNDIFPISRGNSG